MKAYDNDIKRLKNVRELLITIDMVNGFIKEGTLAAPSIMRIVKRQQELLSEVIKNEAGISVFIRDSHPKNATEFKTFAPHCIEGTSESEVIDELKPYEEYSLEYLKNSTNLIFAKNLQRDLEALNHLDRVRLMGCLSEVCVLNGAIGLKTLFDEHNMNVDVCVHHDAIDTYDAPNHNAEEVTNRALEMMESNGIKIL